MAIQAFGNSTRVVYNPYNGVNFVHKHVEQQDKLSKEQCEGIKTFFTTLFSKDNVHTNVRATLVDELRRSSPDQGKILQAIGAVAFRKGAPYEMQMYQYSQALVVMFNLAISNLNENDGGQLREITVQDQAMLRCIAAFIMPMGSYYSAPAQDLVTALVANIAQVEQWRLLIQTFITIRLALVKGYGKEHLAAFRRGDNSSNLNLL